MRVAKVSWFTVTRGSVVRKQDTHMKSASTSGRKSLLQDFLLGSFGSYPPRIYCYRVIDEGRGMIFFEDILSTMNR